MPLRKKIKKIIRSYAAGVMGNGGEPASAIPVRALSGAANALL
jgi:hypothetical protein